MSRSEMDDWWRAAFARSASINFGGAFRDLHARLLVLEGRFDELRELQAIEEAFFAEQEADRLAEAAKKKTRWFWQKPSA